MEDINTRSVSQRFQKKMLYGVDYDFDDKRIKSVVLELANQDAKIMTIVTLSGTDLHRKQNKKL